MASSNLLIAVLQASDNYAARSIAKGGILGTKWTHFVRMPELKGKSKYFYLKAYGNEEYAKHSDSLGTYHGANLTKRAADPPFHYRPEHDVESVLWVLLSLLVRAQPLGEAENPVPDAALALWNTLQTHEIKTMDQRMVIFKERAGEIERALHPHLTFLSKLLVDLLDQTAPEYAYLDPPPVEDHLHEAFRRLLLKQIVEMNDYPVPLDVQHGRDFG